MDQIHYSRAESEDHLRSILRLQQANLRETQSQEKWRKEGYVTVEHDFELLKEMNQPFGHCIALDGDSLIGYALVMEKKWRDRIEVLVPMFEQVEAQQYKGRPLSEIAYFIMGQVCIDKEYRGKGVFRGLYQALERSMSPYFECCVTEISTANQRSLRAHLRVGFKQIHSYPENEEQDWIIVLQDYRS